MESNIRITKKVSEIIVEICQKVVEFNNLYNSDSDESAKELFQHNENIAVGLRKFINSKDNHGMMENLTLYRTSIEKLLNVYTHLNLSFAHKQEMILVLKDLKQSILNLENQLAIK